MQLNRTAVAAVVVGGVIVAAVGYAVWKAQEAGALPKGIVSINGRVEATQVDIATKIAGRIIEIVPHEGDMVAAGSDRVMAGGYFPISIAGSNQVG
jgi:HlyD family secretion protein